MRFDAFIGIDWSGATGNYDGIAIARCEAASSAPKLIGPPGARRWTRSNVASWICAEVNRSPRLLIGLDFAFGLPFEDRHGYLGGRARAVDSIFALWKLIDESSSADADFGCTFANHPQYASLFWKSGPKPAAWNQRKRRTEFACAEATQTHPETVYKLLGSKQVGKASISGIRVLRHIRERSQGAVTFWPFEKVGGSVMVEIYPTLFRKKATGSTAKLRTAKELNVALERFGSRRVAEAQHLSDHDTDALISAAGLRWIARNPSVWSQPELSTTRVQREGWIFGVGE